MCILRETLLCMAILLFASSCTSDHSKVTIEKSPYGTTVDGIDVHEYKLFNRQGMEISIM